MAKVRVYELAKELGVESKVVLAKLQDMGEFVRSASSTVEPPVVRKLKEVFPAQPAGDAAPAKKTTKKTAAKKAAPARKPAPAPVKKAVAAPASKKAVVAKPTPAKAAPVKAVVPKPVPAPVKAVPGKAAPAKTAPAPSKAAPAPKKEPAAPIAAPKAAAPIRKPQGKVAVAMVSRVPNPAPKGKLKVVPYQTDEATGRPILPAGYKPGADEEYMSPLQLEYFRQRLANWRSDLVEESKQTIENLKEEVRDVGDEAERATRETENSLELRTRDRYRKLIGKIDSTLKRVDGGDYGFCVDTGEEIGLDRMEARLTAERTIDAQERWEHMQKQMGD